MDKAEQLGSNFSSMTTWIHDINPIAFWIGEAPISWYWLFYPLGLSIILILTLKYRHSFQVGAVALLEAMAWSWVGVLVGGRLGYALLYNFELFAQHPEAIYQIWLGGMSFHGALLGGTFALALWTRGRHESLWDYSDLIATFLPLGLLLGRVGNFINGELYGRATMAPWGMAFPLSGDLTPRHPSQLYEAAAEGLLLFLILFLGRHKLWPHRGRATGLFLLGYGLFRGLLENFREPDPQVGFLWGGWTLGQLLSVIMMLVGITILWQIREPRPKTG